jgi:hypothetical protein
MNQLLLQVVIVVAFGAFCFGYHGLYRDAQSVA